MTTRRGARPTHVRPRPPVQRPPTPVKVRPRAPAPGRLAVHRPICAAAACRSSQARRSSSRSSPWAPASCTSAPAGCGPSPAAVGRRSAGSSRTSPRPRSPSRRSPVVSDAPSLEAPEEPYTNRQVDLDRHGPGRARRRPRRTGSGSTSPSRTRRRRRIQEVPSADRRDRSSRSSSTKGINDFTVTLIGPGGESESSPSCAMSSTRRSRRSRSPRRRTARPSTARGALKGKVQARSTLIARNDDERRLDQRDGRGRRDVQPEPARSPPAGTTSRSPRPTRPATPARPS